MAKTGLCLTGNPNPAIIFPDIQNSFTNTKKCTKNNFCSSCKSDAVESRIEKSLVCRDSYFKKVSEKIRIYRYK